MTDNNVSLLQSRAIIDMILTSGYQWIVPSGYLT